jgi:hypothetical protein
MERVDEDDGVIPVTRGATPLSEWDENDTLLGGAFANLFMLGKVKCSSRK